MHASELRRRLEKAEASGLRHCPNCGENHDPQDFDPRETSDQTLGGTPLISYYWHCDLCRVSLEIFVERDFIRRKLEEDFVI